MRYALDMQNKYSLDSQFWHTSVLFSFENRYLCFDSIYVSRAKEKNLW